MTLDPHRASVVVDLLESATRAGALEKQEAAAILSSWIEEQKQVRSGASSPGPESEPSQTPPPILSSAAAASTTMTIKTTTMTTTTPQSQTLPAQLPGSPIVAASHSVISFRDAEEPLTPSRIRRLSQYPPAGGMHASMPNTPTTGGQFYLPQQPSPPPLSTAVMSTTTTTATSMGQHYQQQQTLPRQQRKRSRRQRSVRPMRSLLHVFAACAIGDGGDDSGDSDNGCRTDCGHTAPLHHRFYLDPPPLPPLPTPSPMLSPLQSLAEPLPRPASSGSDPQTYAQYDLTDAEQHTYCYIDEADLVDCLPNAATTSAKSAPDHCTEAASPSGTSDSGVYGFGMRVQAMVAAEAAQD